MHRVCLYLLNSSIIVYAVCLNFRTYLPVLKNFPTKYIHEPWTAPESVQRAAKCVIGRDYPMPMVDHIKQSQNNIERMKQVYQQLAHYRGSKSEYGESFCFCGGRGGLFVARL